MYSADRRVYVCVYLCVNVCVQEKQQTTENNKIKGGEDRK